MKMPVANDIFGETPVITSIKRKNASPNGAGIFIFMVSANFQSPHIAWGRDHFN